MRRKGVSLAQIYDARALRVVVGDGNGTQHVAAVEGCYDLLRTVHGLVLNPVLSRIFCMPLFRAVVFIEERLQ